MIEVLVLYYSRSGAVETLAREVCRGIDAVPDAAARLRTVPEVSAVTTAAEHNIPADGPPFVSNEDLKECAGLVMGSPTRFGNMSASLKYFIDSTTSDWFAGSLSGKPAGVFTSTSSLHGGQESTLLSMALPLIHHGMIFVGIPYSEPALSKTTTGGTPYGASHVSWGRDPDNFSVEEKELAQALGSRVAKIALKLSSTD